MAEKIETMVPGNVWKVLVKAGDKVAAGDVLFILEVMKTEVPHNAGEAGTVKASRKARKVSTPVRWRWRSDSRTDPERRSPGLSPGTRSRLYAPPPAYYWAISAG